MSTSSSQHGVSTGKKSPKETYTQYPNVYNNSVSFQDEVHDTLKMFMSELRNLSKDMQAVKVSVDQVRCETHEHKVSTDARFQDLYRSQIFATGNQQGTSPFVGDLLSKSPPPININIPPVRTSKTYTQKHSIRTTGHPTVPEPDQVPPPLEGEELLSARSHRSHVSIPSVSMPDVDPFRTHVAPTTSPQQFIALTDVPSFQPGSDLHLFFQQIEGSYIGSLPDADKIYKTTNKLIPVYPIYQHALQLSATYKSWPHFRNKLLKEHGKNQMQIINEYEAMRIDSQEKVSSFVDRLYAKLWEPAAKLPEYEILKLIHNKLPKQFKAPIQVYGDKKVKSVSQLRKKVQDIEKDYVHLKLQDLQRQVTRNPEAEIRQKPTYQNRYKQPGPNGKDTPKEEKPKTSTSKKQQNYLVQYDNENPEPTSGSSEEEEAPASDGSIETYTLAISPQTGAKVLAHDTSSPKKNRLPAQNTGIQKQKPKGNKLEKITERTLEETSDLDNFESGPSSQQAQQTAPQPQMETQPTPPTFQRFAQDQPPREFVDSQIEEARLRYSNGRRIVLEDNLFLDDNGNFDLSLLEDSVRQSFSITQLRKMRDRLAQGHPVIYHAGFEHQKNEINAYYERLEQTNQIQSEIIRLEGYGSHMIALVHVETIQVRAIVDTGAQRTIISKNLVDNTGLSSKLVRYPSPPPIIGVGGSTCIVHFLEQAHLSIQGQTFTVDVPVIPQCSFDMLLGQDILLKGLCNCQIHFDSKFIQFDVYKQDGTKTTEHLPLEESVRSTPTQAMYMSYMFEQLDSVFPEISFLPGRYDMALLDLPLKYPPFFKSSIPYSTYNKQTFVLLKHVLERIMADNSILLIWCSGRSISDILYLIVQWGYTYVTVFLVWLKLTQSAEPQLNLGWWSRGNCEFLLLAKRGQCSHFKSTNKSIPQCFYTLSDTPENNLHSSKPVKAYDLMCQALNLQSMQCIELFARCKNSQVQRTHFDLYGDEVPKFFQRCVKNSQVGLETYVVAPEQTFSKSLQLILGPKRLQAFHIFLSNLNMSDSYKANPRVVELLARHFECFDYDGKVGKSKNVQLNLKIREGAKPPKPANIRMDPERHEFWKTTIDDWIAKDFLEEGPTDFVHNPVIVGKKGPTKYRLCYNFQPLNEVSYDEEFDSLTVDEIIQEASKAKILCSLDCVSAHQSIQVNEKSRKYLGMKTPYGTMRSKVGQFGLLTISKVFNKGIARSIGHLRKKGIYVFADDINSFSQTLEESLDALDETFTCLQRDGYVLSARKCTFFKSELEILGQKVGQGQVRIAQSKVEAIQALPLPETKKQLQHLVGCLNYVRKFIPNLASLLKPLYDIMKGPEKLDLSSMQQQTIQHLKGLLSTFQVLVLPNRSKPFYITLSFNQFGYGAALLQKENNHFRPVAYRSKLNQTEAWKPQYLLKLEALAQALKEWRQILYCSQVYVLTNNPILKHALAYQGDDIQVNRLLGKFLGFKIEVKVKPASFKALKYSQLLISDDIPTDYYALDQLLEEYEKLRINSKIKMQTKAPVDLNLSNFEVNAFFDGACTRKGTTYTQGSFGFVVLDSRGQETHFQSGPVDVDERVTNNIAECFALLQLVKYLRCQYQYPFINIQILGDSELVIKQLKGIYRVNSNALRFLQRDVKAELKFFKRVVIRNIPRELNEKANDLAQNALKEVIVWSTHLLSFQLFAVTQPDVLNDIPCIACGRSEPQDSMLLCDSCGRGQHDQCLGELVDPQTNSFYCKSCEHYVLRVPSHNMDITQDISFLDFLDNPAISMEAHERRRCVHLARFYFLQEGILYFHDIDGPKKVPTPSDRHLVTLQVHQSQGHCGVQATVRLLKLHYFWPNMLQYVRQLVQRCLLCQARKQSFLPMPNVYPTYKGLSIWQYVSVDLLQIRTQEQGQERYILSCICAYCKAPELITLPNKRASTVANAFRDNVLYRYGSPLVVRSDEGTEFKGEFAELLERSGIVHIQTGPYYPQANGLVERLNRTIKEKLQSLFNSEEYSDDWGNLVQAIAFSIRISRSRATTFSPFQLMYGRDPLLPGHYKRLQQDVFYEPSEQELSATMNKLVSNQKLQEQVAVDNLKSMNDEIRDTVEAREFKSLTNLQFGQPIFIRQGPGSKIDLELTGPAYFIRYRDSLKCEIIFYSPSSRRFLTANISNVKLQLS